MARPRSDDKQTAILAGATRVIASQGLGASTAAIAKESGVSNGSLFTYFDTKADLLNQLYIELKTEMSSVIDGIPADHDLREQALYMWTQWMNWAASFPEKRRALALLNVSDEVTPESRQTARQVMSGVREFMRRITENGPMREEPLGLRVALLNGVAEATIDYMMQDPANADKHRMVGFEAFWRMVV
ncbi:TetR/AcrR family transcriptional regulator [Paenibacillus pinistramenti]|uniref:TetR/AcrR family transcriptional regulator n=1 Tax=Paenibacillus pinistramenti TaxID=1768003 RepID=UPI001109063A|nr:TetR/AcrR family transcriptional regulator [Paenibacillus pinistramenti]